MSDYTKFEVKDFLKDENFIKWIRNPDEKLNRFWENWIIKHSEQKSNIDLATAIIKGFTHASSLPEAFYTSLKQSIDTTIAHNVPVKKLSLFYKLNTLRAASVFTAIAVGASVLYIYLQPAATIKITTAYKQVKTIELPDHSLVTLNAHSSLEYPKHWNNKKREVTLNGEGFFNITHLEKQKILAKFIVHTNEVNVQVLGTEFNVKNRNNLTDVVLQTGKVQLQIQGSDAIHIMNPNDFISFNSKTKEINSQTVNPTYYTAWLNHKLTFSKVTLKEVCSLLQDFYGLTFRIENESFASQQISGTLLLQDEQSLLQTLSSLLNSNIKQEGTQITIYSK